MNADETSECSIRAARRQNLIIDIRSPHRGEVHFTLHIGNKQALPKGFLRRHCRRVGWLRRLLTIKEALQCQFPSSGTHRLRYSFTYRPQPDEQEIARKMQVNEPNFYLKQDLAAPFTRMQQAGFRLVGGVGWGQEYCPAWQYNIWRARAQGADTFPVIYPRYPYPRSRQCWLGTAREWPQIAEQSLRGKG